MDNRGASVPGPYVKGAAGKACARRAVRLKASARRAGECALARVSTPTMDTPTFPAPLPPGPTRVGDHDLLRAVAARLVVLAGRVDAAGCLTQLDGPLLGARRLPVENLLGQNVLTRYPAAAGAVRAALRGEPVRLDWRVRTSDDGCSRQMEVNLVPDEGGGIVFFLRDISDCRRLEREVLEIADGEQRRLGQDLHDGLGQHLAGTAYLAEILRQQLAAAGSPAAAGAAQVTALIHDAIDQTRALARNLCPGDLGPHNLRRALRSLAAGVSATCQVRCELLAPSGPGAEEELPLPGGAGGATHLYRLTQEAVGNAVRHGQARHIAISLDREAADDGREPRATLRVRDDGTGFDGRADDADDDGGGPGLGLHVMRYRAHHLGGTLSIHPAPPRGTAVCCTFPVVTPAAGPEPAASTAPSPRV